MVKVGAIQMSMSEDKLSNINKAEELVREASKNGAQIILLPELFEGLYFCKDMNEKYFSWASPREGNPLIERFAALAKELHVVMLISYFEKSDEGYFNSLVVADADGRIMDNYRKTHIPDGPGYEEKFYFKPGNSGFKVYDTAYAKIGVGICWDQWFCETARALTLMGAEIIFYPTAIGSEPEIHLDSKEHWQRVQMGHAATNTVPVVVANRIGEEKGDICTLNFYGSSFITDYTGAKIAEASRDKEEIIYASFDIEDNQKQRHYWGLIRDRQPKAYSKICELF
ncbi:MAG: N-carbamoylputrescine amidase [Sulfurimonas sp. RIFOXYD12_FULL_33_39]|uniref:N-carbamoylputrescine amidase n=1 Tax=unclassified Sulfurimonas TaxID=2623549 RepID=UPI0008BEF9C5|nr:MULTISPECIES: N-carbamoylputrescine amidase [unclassified Sulfurimonas]OHE09728.1 MAG: N-carbamoylputrescine amidase [Sulfurimonas sp. RIFOXYD12_FULL_33_39]OHE13764.1 MAG: N-carbamoylputrescine amidase [Sulfurimonas sp. RIFOXYD2_FULL_34_21]DAB28688.1 MAG TPA: N-carbamoylputrescine amidase [Sulfurimonas sp. UBA10385]